MSSPSSCSENNSTEAMLCLLRLITDNTKPDWNWDPLNFGVTAAIGLLALVIAAITVFQGLLAAGPGRLKASNLAIGPFSIHSHSRFDRTELALRTTARVPLITWDVVYHRIVRQKFRPNFRAFPGRHHGESASQLVDEFDEGMRTFSTTSIDERHQYDSTATWLTLLTTLGMDDPQFFPLVQRVTDYLAADVQAAPAAAELRCLAILAVIADTGATIEPAANRFIRVSADSSQLVFRDHPIMGTVAAYEAYEATAMLKVGESPPLQFGTQVQSLAFEDLDRCLQLASGRLSYADGRIPPSLDGVPDERAFLTLVLDLHRRSGGCNHDICMHAFDDWTNSLTDIRERTKAWHYITAIKRLYMVASLLGAERANICRGFPKKRMMLMEGLEDLLKLSDFWSTDITYMKLGQLGKIACMTFWNQSSISYQDTLSASWIVDFKDSRSTVNNPFSATTPSMQKQRFKEDKTMVFMQRIRSFVTKLLDPSDTASTNEFEEHRLPSAAVAHLLTCLDEWLLRKGGSTASCDALTLLYRLGFQSGLLTTVRDVIPRGSFSFDTLDAAHVLEFLAQSGAEKKSLEAKMRSAANVKECEGIDMSLLLILRGILMALLLDDGADTSILYQSDFRNPIVRML